MLILKDYINFDLLNILWRKFFIYQIYFLPQEIFLVLFLKFFSVVYILRKQRKNFLLYLIVNLFGVET